MTAGARSGEVSPSLQGGLTVSGVAATIHPGAFLENWGGLRVCGGVSEDERGARNFRLCAYEDGKTVDILSGALRARTTGAEVEIAYDFCVLRDRFLKQLCILIDVPVEKYAGGDLVFDERKITLPVLPERGHLVGGNAKSVGLRGSAGGREFGISTSRPILFAIQDNRLWDVSSYSLRLILAGAKTYRFGETYSVVFRLVTPDGAFMSTDSSGIKIGIGRDWIPVVVAEDVEPGSALDFSGLRTTGMPAGCHGHVVVRNAHFSFEDSPGVVRRFYGVNLCGYANVPRPEDSERLAQRLAAMGYNAVRFHHHECVLVKDDGVSLDEGEMMKFDKLVAECVKNGLYLTTDLFVSRRPISYRSIGIDQDGLVGASEFRELVLVHPGAYENFIAFVRSFLGHMNPLTGRTLATEPALGWLALVNEGNLGNNDMQYMMRHNVFAERWRAFVADKRRKNSRWKFVSEELPKGLSDWKDPHVGAYTLFMQSLEMDFARRVGKFLREELGCRALISDLSAWHFPVAYQLPRASSYDYVDCHFYADHPEFLETAWSLPSKCPNVNPFLERNLAVTKRVFGRVWERPFVVSEFNFSGPGRYRAIGGIAAGALAALQDWDAMWRFAWSHDKWSLERPREKAMRYFDLNGDPLLLASERAAVCLFLRGDMKPLQRRFALAIPQAEMCGLGCARPIETDQARIAWKVAVGSVCSEVVPEGFDNGAVFPAGLKELGPMFDRPKSAGDDMVRIDTARGSLAICTLATCGGFAEQGHIQAGSMNADIGSTPTTIWVSSVDGLPVNESKRLLVTHLTDLQNADTKYADRDLTVLTDWGHLPHVMRRGCAALRIEVVGGDWRVYALNGRGTRFREIPSIVRDGWLCFSADNAVNGVSATYLYELVWDDQKKQSAKGEK